MPAGRPTDYTPEIVETICARLANGESLRTVCLDDEMPAQRTVFNWLAVHKEFVQQYARAREAQTDRLAEEIMEISDNGENDTYTKSNADGSTFEAVNFDHIQRSKLRVDTRKWLMARMAPKKYGDKVTQEHVGDPDRPVVQRIERVIVDPSNPDG